MLVIWAVKKRQNCKSFLHLNFRSYLLCCPEMVPHRVGGSETLVKSTAVYERILSGMITAKNTKKSGIIFIFIVEILSWINLTYKGCLGTIWRKNRLVFACILDNCQPKAPKLVKGVFLKN